MTVIDRLSEAGPIDLPAEAGDVNAPKFEPNEGWLRLATADLQKAALWRWFATRFEAPHTATPHDAEGNYLFAEGEPILADQILRERFRDLVPGPVIQEVITVVCQEVGNKWAFKRLDKVGD